MQRRKDLKGEERGNWDLFEVRDQNLYIVFIRQINNFGM